MVFMDHNVLTSIRKMKDAAGRVSRWFLFLQDYNFETVHRPGRTQLVADALSQNPIPIERDQEGDESDDDGPIEKSERQMFTMQLMVVIP